MPEFASSSPSSGNGAGVEDHGRQRKRRADQAGLDAAKAEGDLEAGGVRPKRLCFAAASSTPQASGEGSEEAAAPTKVSSSEDFWRVQVEAVYRKRNPYKLENVPKLLEKYAGSEVTLYRKVCMTYDLDPSKFYADAESWGEEGLDADVVAAQEGASGASLVGRLVSLGSAVLLGPWRALGSLRAERLASQPRAQDVPPQHLAVKARPLAAGSDGRGAFSFVFKDGVSPVFSGLRGLEPGAGGAPSAGTSARSPFELLLSGAGGSQAKATVQWQPVRQSEEASPPAERRPALRQRPTGRSPPAQGSSAGSAPPLAPGQAFGVGHVVEYMSRQHSAWVLTRVQGFDPTGQTYHLDLKHFAPVSKIRAFSGSPAQAEALMAAQRGQKACGPGRGRAGSAEGSAVPERTLSDSNRPRLHARGSGSAAAASRPRPIATAAAPGSWSAALGLPAEKASASTEAAAARPV